MVLWPGLHPASHWGNSQRSPDLLAGLDGHFLSERGRERLERGREGKGRLWKGMKGALALKRVGWVGFH